MQHFFLQLIHYNDGIIIKLFTSNISKMPFNTSPLPIYAHPSTHISVNFPNGCSINLTASKVASQESY
jgi:hypothetical protein